MLRILIAIAFALAACDAFMAGEHGDGPPPGAKDKMSFYKNIPECGELMEREGGQFKLTGCPQEVNDCMKASHDKAKLCVAGEIKEWMKVPEARDCHKSNKPYSTAWFKASCKWHLSVAKCMDGDSVDSDFEAEEVPEGHDHHRRKGMRHFKNQDCWKEVRTMTRECNQKAKVDCENYKACSGKGPKPEDERLGQWYDVAKSLRHKKHTAARTMGKKMKECLGDALGTPAPEPEAEPAW